MREKKKFKIGLSDYLLGLLFRQALATPEKKRTLSTINFDSILVYSTTALGDYMFNSPALRAIRQRYPSAKITLVVHPKYKDLITTRDFYDDVLFWTNKASDMLTLVRQAKERKPQLAILLHSHLPYDVVSAAMAGCRYIVRDNYAKPVGRMNRWLTYGLDEFDEHVIARKMKLVSALGCETDNVAMALPCAYEKQLKPEGVIRIGFQLGASTLVRCWPPEYYAELAQRLIASDSRIEVALIGSAPEKGLAEALMQHAEPALRNKITNHVGKTSLPQLLGVIASMDLLVTGDTGPLHLAIALRVPTLSLFVTENPCRSGPYQDKDRHEYIYLPLEDPRVVDEQAPLKAISVGEVFDCVERMLAH